MARSERNLNSIFQDTADAIRAKTGGTDEINPRDFADEIEAIPSGGGGSEIVPGPNDNVIVYDYDGTVLDAKQVAVGQEYTLPEPPEHEGLTFESWVATAPISNGKITIPATKLVAVSAYYHTTSGYLELDVYAPKNVPVTLASAWTNVDWGDGTTTTSSNTHTYAAEGEYTIKVLNNVTSIPSYGSIMDLKIIKRVRLCQSITTLSNSAFDSQYSIESVAVTSSVASYGSSAFNGLRSLKFAIVKPRANVTYMCDSCFSLKTALIPYGVTETSSQIFNNCMSINRVVIPEGVTTINNNSFYYCYGLTSLKFPKSVTTFGSNGIGWCTAVGVLDFSTHESIPTIQSNSFSIPATAKIIVPDALYDSWIAASNWSNLASKIVKASEA